MENLPAGMEELSVDGNPDEQTFRESKKGLQRGGQTRRVARRKTIRGEGRHSDMEGDDRHSDECDHEDDDNPENNNTVKAASDGSPLPADVPGGQEAEGDDDPLDPSFTLPPWATTIASVVKPVMGYITDKALSFMKVTLQYVPDVDTSEDEDGEFMDAEQDSDSEFEDAEPQLGEKDRIQHICEELLRTEEDYVRRLHILVKVKTRTTEILKPEIANMMFKDIETIYQFHYNTLLPQLQERLKYWEKYRRIGDIMKKFAPFLKLYTEYVKNFEAANQLVTQWAEKSSKFATFLKEVQTSPEHGRLKVQAHMLEPVQRVPRYQLLLKDYLKRLTDDSIDRADTQEALGQVVRAASHFEAMMKRDTRIGQLMSLQHHIEGPVSLVSASREFVHKGKIGTVSAKNGKHVDRFAFLFNDLLLICNEMGLPVPGMSNKYKVKHKIDLDEAQISANTTSSADCSFYIQTTEKIIELAFTSTEEKEKWLELLSKYMKESTKEKLLHIGSVRVRAPKEQMTTLGKQAPLMVHLSKATQCMICSAEFSPLRRKKQCRACGNVVCAKCSNRTAVLEYDKSKPLKVCDECFIIIQETSGSPAVFQTYSKPKTEGICLEKGSLHVSVDGGRSWKRRWLTLHDSAKLYSYKNAQERTPIDEIDTSEYSFELSQSGQRKGPVITATGIERSFLLAADTAPVLDRWHKLLSSESAEAGTSLEEAVALATAEDRDSLSSIEGVTVQTGLRQGDS